MAREKHTAWPVTLFIEALTISSTYHGACCSMSRCRRPAVQQVTEHDSQKTTQWWLCAKHSILPKAPASFQVTFAKGVIA